ncbi:ABC-type multidrug transport system ATPase subunit [Anaerotaenia torta]|uniref:ATP-binding cassette domain-containing protein n=1 Tax=Anaerotaenia torta TaxID=433293 RepID=UPI003D1EEF6D
MIHYTLTAENIKMRYGENAVLNEVSIHVEYRDIYGLVGKNGSGKTTLLRILTGLIQNFNGTVSIAKTEGRESRFAAVINDPSLFLNMSAFENMKEQAHLLGLHDNSQIEQALEIVGLEIANNKPVSQFSLGMVQRLKLAMALLQKPDILILDEPMNGLDPDGIADLRELLLCLHENGMTILISSHILSELEQVITRLGILHDGKIVKEIAAHDAFQNGTSLEKLYMQYTKGGKAND